VLFRSVQWVKPGGTLVYSVCSLEPQEGEEIIAGFLRSHEEFRIDRPTGLPVFVTAAAEGWIRIVPGLLAEKGGLDGFFMARLVHHG